jgi:phosphoglycolate phosphatase-like HAD superfamily hydrolase
MSALHNNLSGYKFQSPVCRRPDVPELPRLHRISDANRAGCRAVAGNVRARHPPSPAAIAMTIGHSLVIFDVEGTLVDSATLTLRCWQETLQSFGFEFSLATLQRHSGQDPHDMLHELLPGPRVTRVLPRVIEAQGRLYRDKYLPQARAFPHVRALFERVKCGRQRIAVATSSSADELDHYLALANVGDLVDAVACGDDVQHDKPDSALIEVALLRAGKLAPKDAIMIGDTPYDAIAAKRLGVGSIGMLSGGFSRQELEASGCIAVYRDPADLLAHYEETVRLQA